MKTDGLELYVSMPISLLIEEDQSRADCEDNALDLELRKRAVFEGITE
jgi:hypothetical protein